MSRGQQFAQFDAGARRYLDPDVGPTEDEGCAVGGCEDAAVYRVPWPEFGGDVAYCSFHLARYQHQHPDLFDRVQDRVDANLDALATRGQRWLALEAVPERIRSGRYRRVGVTARGYALFERAQPDENGRVTYVLVDRNRDYQDAIEVPAPALFVFVDVHRPRSRDVWGVLGDRPVTPAVVEPLQGVGDVEVPSLALLVVRVHVGIEVAVDACEAGRHLSDPRPLLPGPLDARFGRRIKFRRCSAATEAMMSAMSQPWPSG